jgi:hypothetical protein
MFQLRHKRTARDRESGLVFPWRLPVSSHFGFLSAFLLVALITAGLAATVRIHVGGAARQPERRGTLIVVPHGPEWRSLEMTALEAGPMPRRADPAGEPAVAGLIRGGLSAALPPGFRYTPEWKAVAIEMPPAAAAAGSASKPVVLPPLPKPAPPAAGPPKPDPSLPLVLGDGKVRALAPPDPPPASLARGNIYLLGYDSRGRVTRVTTLAATTPAGDDGGELWLRKILIEGGDPRGGWTSVEIAGGS